MSYILQSWHFPLIPSDEQFNMTNYLHKPIFQLLQPVPISVSYIIQSWHFPLIPSDEQFSMTSYLHKPLGLYHDIFPENNLGATWANGKSTFYTPTNDNPTTFSWFSPYLGGGSVGILRQHCSLSNLRAGWGWGWSWLGPPCFPSLLTRGRARGAGDNPYTDILLTRPTLNALGILLPNLISTTKSNLNLILFLLPVFSIRQ